MLNKTQHVYLFLFVVVMLSSCSSYFSIEKRKFRDGFYVHQNIFHSKKKQSSDKISFNENNDTTSFAMDSHTIAQGNNSTSDLQIIPSPIIIQSTKIYQRIINVNTQNILLEKKKSFSSKINEKKRPTNDDRKVPVLALIGFILCYLALFLIFYNILIGFSQIIIHISLIAYVVGLIISVIAGDMIDKHQEKYKGKGFTKATLYSFYFALLCCLIFGIIILIES